MPGTVALVGGGVGSVQGTSDGVAGPVVLSAAAGIVVGSAVVELSPLTSLPGEVGGRAASALPFVGYRQRPQDYAFGAPDLPGLDLSFTTVTLILEATATVGAGNDRIDRYGVLVGGSCPGSRERSGPSSCSGSPPPIMAPCWRRWRRSRPRRR